LSSLLARRRQACGRRRRNWLRENNSGRFGSS